jgi:hypothetical protein
LNVQLILYSFFQVVVVAAAVVAAAAVVVWVDHCYKGNSKSYLL